MQTDEEFAETLFGSLGKISDLTDEGRDAVGVTRISYGLAETELLRRLEQVANAQELYPWWDSYGNLWVMRRDHPRDPDFPTVLIGSHVDTVDGGGRYDGFAGVVAGLICLRRGVPAKVLALRGEESVWYNQSCKGSKALFGRLASDLQLQQHMFVAANYHDTVSLSALDSAFSGRPSLSPSAIKAFLELHIEQGPVLEAAKVPVGIVTGIVGHDRYEIQITGEANHSGTTPMHLRKDPLMEAVYLVRGLCEAAQSLDATMTTGKFHTDDRGAMTRIPERVQLSLEWRSLAKYALERMRRIFHKSPSREVSLEVLSEQHADPVTMDTNIQNLMYRLAGGLGIPHRVLPSGAGHDAGVFAENGVPSGMIFVRNQNGSHNPNESMRTEDFMAGVKVLEMTARDLLRI